MRIPSGVTDQYIYFVAVDATDLITRETGLSSFTVRRSRNGGASAAYTTPTINETDSSNMPGVYELLLDEDMTIDSGDDSQEVCLHITHAGMAPVTLKFELYRPKLTAGNTLSVESDGDLTKVNTLDGHTAQTGDAFARLGAPAGASVSADVAAIKAETASILDDTDLIDDGTSGLAKIATDVAAILVDTADIQPKIGTPAGASVSADIAAVKAETASILTDTAEIGAAGAGLTALASAANLATVDGVVDAIKAKTDNLPSDPADASDIAAAFGTVNSTLGTIAGYIDTEIAAIKAKTDNLPSDPADQSSIEAILGTPAGASLAADIAAVKSDTAAILVDTGTTLQAELDGIQADTEDIQSRLPAALVSGRIDASVGAMATDTVTAAALAADAVAEINATVDAAISDAALATAAALATVDGNVDSILADTNELQTDWANGGRLDLILDARASQTSVDDLPTNAELATALAAADDAVLAAIAALNNLSAAQVNAEVVDALATDTYAEPGQGAPAATTSLAAKLNYLYKAWRNKSTATASQQSLYNDAGDTIDQKRTLADDDTTFTAGEMGTGP